MRINVFLMIVFYLSVNFVNARQLFEDDCALDKLSSFTTFAGGYDVNDQDWIGNVLAVVGGDSSDNGKTQVFSWNSSDESLAFVTEATFTFDGGNKPVSSCAWNGNYLAVSGGENGPGGDVVVYDYDSGNATLTEVERKGLNASPAYSMAWNGDFLAASVTAFGNPFTEIYLWNGSNTLTSKTQAAPAGVVSWSGSNLLVIGDFLTTFLTIYEWNGVDTLTQKDNEDIGFCSRSLSWNGVYVAVGGESGNVKIYELNTTSSTVTQKASVTYSGGDEVKTVSWYDNTLMVAGVSGDVEVYQWDSGASSLTNLNLTNIYDSGKNVHSSAWNNDYVTVGGVDGKIESYWYGNDIPSDNAVFTRQWNGGEYIAVGRTSDKVELYELNHTTTLLQKPTGVQVPQQSSDIKSIAWGKNALLVGDVDGSITLYDWNTTDSFPLISNSLKYTNSKDVLAVAWQDDTHVAVSGLGGTIEIYEWSD